ncbi:MAG: glycosyltransferase family 39 protein, partial [Bacteroidetes bacterium]|nr:glycosyltransferase family 39 protein [Bacteroidota bacterium]
MFFIIYSIYHVATLAITPTPWLDEGLLLSLSQSFSNTGNFHLDLAPHYDFSRNYNLYGPVYFCFTHFFTDTFGYGIFQFRITALLFGLLSILIFRRIIQEYFDVAIANLFGFLLLLDPVFQNNMHEARMDTMALFFIGASLLTCIFFLKKENKQMLLFSALFGLLALLTTPRSGFVLLFIAYPVLKTGFRNIIIWSTPIVLVYSCWSYWAFDGFSNTFNYYNSFNELFNLLTPSTLPLIPFLSWPLIVLVVTTAIFVPYRKLFRDRSEVNKILFVIGPVLFLHLFVKGGYYFIYVIPFYYWLYLLLAQHAGQKILRIFTTLILMLNIGLMSAKAINLMLQNNDAHDELVTFIGNHIPSESKVIAKEKFYYACIANNLEYQSSVFWWTSTPQQKEKYHTEVYDYDYLIQPFGESNYYTNIGKFDTIAVFQSDVTENFIQTTLKKLNLPISINKKIYDMAILRRKRIAGKSELQKADHYIYLAVHGNDSLSGDIDHPIQSIAELTIRLKSISDIQNQSVNVIFREGEYHLKETLRIDTGMSGISHLSISAYEHEEVILSGSKVIKIDKDEDKVLSIPMTSELQKRNFDGVSRWRKYHQWPTTLFVNNKKLRLAQWPKKGMGTITNQIDSNSFRLVNEHGDAPKFSSEDRLWVHGFRSVMWMDHYDIIDSLYNDKIELHKINKYKKDQGLKLLNLRQQLTDRGEYYLNYKKGVVEFIPPKCYYGKVEFSERNSIILVNGMSNVDIIGLQMGKTNQSALVIENARNISVDNCIFNFISGDGITIRRS